MDRISAAGNVTIEMMPESWRLIANGGGQEQVLLEAVAGQPLRYLPVFAQKRRLPDTGALMADQVQRVVVGWSHQDESWHLGLLLGPELSQVRGSRWCELARWPDPDTNVFGDTATLAGRSLANAVGCSFNFIKPQPKPVSAPPPLPNLPLKLDQWTLERTGNGLQFLRAGKWARARVIRIVWYALLVVAYVALSLLTLRGDIALPRPEFLPYLGLAVAGLLVFGIVYTLAQLLLIPNRILIFPETRVITALNGSRLRWQLRPEDYQSVYVSQVVGKKGKRLVVQYGELNVMLVSGAFSFLFDMDESADLNAAESNSPLLAELTPQDVHTSLQAAGLYAAQALRVQCWYDRRGR